MLPDFPWTKVFCFLLCSLFIRLYSDFTTGNSILGTFHPLSYTSKFTTRRANHSSFPSPRVKIIIFRVLNWSEEFSKKIILRFDPETDTYSKLKVIYFFDFNKLLYVYDYWLTNSNGKRSRRYRAVLNVKSNISNALKFFKMFLKLKNMLIHLKCSLQYYLHDEDLVKWIFILALNTVFSFRNSKERLMINIILSLIYLLNAV